LFQELWYWLMTGARLVTPGDVGYLDVFHQVLVTLNGIQRIAAHHTDVVLVELESHIRPIRGLNQRRGTFGGIGEVAGHIGGVDVFHQQEDAGRFGQWRRFL
jgi:hypothetical protein